MFASVTSEDRFRVLVRRYTWWRKTTIILSGLLSTSTVLAVIIFFMSLRLPTPIPNLLIVGVFILLPLIMLTVAETVERFCFRRAHQWVTGHTRTHHSY